ncbi:hypothetical protein [Sorangium sp. So ce406]|uniref:hypothetical protein n=1 Tax=Sorangium sp. So ce406 TaxID=3133311 RepID=UPI003F5BEC30
MTVVRIEPSGPVELEAEPFLLEKQLEDAVTSFPNLLSMPEEPGLALVRQQVSLPDAGVLDILLVNAEGLPVVVEAKLARNAQSRREVVGQVVDYVSALTSFTVDELDGLVGGALDAALRSLVGASDDDFEKLWRAVGSNLRAGLARYLILVDEVPAELERIVRFLASRSSLDIGLVTVSRYRDVDGHYVLIPQHVVRSGGRGSGPANMLGKKMSDELAAVVSAYNASAVAGFAAVGRAHNYRQIRPSGWPAGMHYEFVQCADSIGVELHLESPACVSFAGVVEGLAHKTGAPSRVEWYPRWQRGPGRLVSRIPLTQPPSAFVTAMKELIAFSFEEVSTAVRRGNVAEPAHQGAAPDGAPSVAPLGTAPLG